MRLHYWKKGSKMHKDGRHHRKYAMLRPFVLDEEEGPHCGRKTKQFLKHRMPKKSIGHHGKWWKRCKGMRGRSSSSSSDSDDDHHHGKGKHGKGGHHHGKGKHYEVLRGLSCDDEAAVRPCIPVVEGGLRCGTTSGAEAVGRRGGGEKHFGVMRRGRSMSHSDDDEEMARRCLSDVEGGRHGGRRMRFMGMRGHHGHHGRGEHGRGWGMSDSDDDHHHHGKGRHMRGMIDEEEMPRRCMSDVEGGRHGGRRMRFMGMRDHHGHHHGREWSMSDSDDDHHHGKGRHMRGRMMCRHEGKRGMRGYGRRGFFDGDGALVPICATRVQEDRPETSGKRGDVCNQTTGTAEDAADGAARGTTREQGTQTTGILEIVIEDQEALTAAIRIVNKFL